MHTRSFVDLGLLEVRFCFGGPDRNEITFNKSEPENVMPRYTQN